MMKAEDTSSSALSGGSDAGEMAVSRSEGEAGAAAGEVVLASMLAKRAQGRSHFGRLNWKQRCVCLVPGRKEDVGETGGTARQ